MKIAAAATVLVAAMLAAGCGGGSKSAAPPTTAPASTTPPAATKQPVKCLDAPAALVQKLRAHIVLVGARLTHVQVVAAPAFPGFYFVSGRVVGGGAGKLVATWVTPKLAGGGPVYAVDDSAALISTYAGATAKSLSLTVDAPGVYRSRVCVAGPGVAHGENAPAPGSRGAPASS